MQNTQDVNDRQRIQERQNIPKMIASMVVGGLFLLHIIASMDSVGGVFTPGNPVTWVMYAVLWFIIYFIGNHFVMRQEHAELLTAALERQQRPAGRDDSQPNQ